MNYIGLVAAISAFLAIWFGHVAVRKVEASAVRLWVPAAIFILLGLSLEWVALVTESLAVATASGIVGITFLWDALELKRQERRVRKGHAPANAVNPRHAAMLAAPGSKATTVDLLKRGPGDVDEKNGTRMTAEGRGIIY